MLALRTVVVGLVAAVLIGPGPDSAGAMSTVAPVTADDVVVMTPVMGMYWSEVLANDVDPDGGDLQVCRVEAPDDAGLRVQIDSRSGLPGQGQSEPGDTFLRILPVSPPSLGDHLVTYYACDREQLTPATLTIQVREFGADAVAGRPHRVRFTNPLALATRVGWMRPGWDSQEGGTKLGPGQSRVVDVGRGRVQWWAYLAEPADDAFPVGEGTVRADGVPRNATNATVAQSDAPPAVDDVTPPTTAPDHVIIEYNERLVVDVLANDSDDHPEDLGVCRVDVPPGAGYGAGAGLLAVPQPWWLDDEPLRSDGDRHLVVGSVRATPGTYELTYYACDRRHLTPGTVSVTVKAFPGPVVKRVVGTPGTVQVRNRGYRNIVFRYVRQGRDGDEALPQIVLPPHQTRRIHVRYDHMLWFADTKLGQLAQGHIRDVQQDG